MERKRAPTRLAAGALALAGTVVAFATLPQILGDEPERNAGITLPSSSADPDVVVAQLPRRPAPPRGPGLEGPGSFPSAPGPAADAVQAGLLAVAPPPPETQPRPRLAGAAPRPPRAAPTPAPAATPESAPPPVASSPTIVTAPAAAPTATGRKPKKPKQPKAKIASKQRAVRAPVTKAGREDHPTPKAEQAAEKADHKENKAAEKSERAEEKPGKG